MFCYFAWIHFVILSKQSFLMSITLLKCAFSLVSPKGHSMFAYSFSYLLVDLRATYLLWGATDGWCSVKLFPGRIFSWLLDFEPHNTDSGHQSIGSSEMMRNLSAMNYSRSVPNSLGVHWASSPGFGRMEHPAPLPGIFGRFETSYGRGSYAGDAGNFEAALTGKRYTSNRYMPSKFIITEQEPIPTSLREISISCIFLWWQEWGLYQNWFC